MSMICWLLGVSPAQIAAIERTPKLASDVAQVARNNARQERMAVYRARETPEQRRAREERESADRKAYPELAQAEVHLNEARSRVAPIGPFEKPHCLEKSWQILHYLMTGHGWETLREIERGVVAPGPGDALLTGKPLGDNLGYGPARLHDDKATAAFARFLATLDVATLQSRVNLQRLRAEQIYAVPTGPGGDATYEAELRAAIAHFFPLMRDYVADMAGKRNGLLVWLD